MFALKRHKEETALKLFQKNPAQEDDLSALLITENFGSEIVAIKPRTLLPKERNACDMATD